MSASARGPALGPIKEEDSMVVLASSSDLTLRDGAVRCHAIHSLRQHLRQFLYEFLDGQPGFRGQLLQQVGAEHAMNIGG